MKTMIILIVFTAVLVLLLNLTEPPEPLEYVENRTFEKHSNLLFDYDIIRYPAGAEITPIGSLNSSIVLGFVTDSWNLNFGGIPANGSYATRTIKLSNKEDKAVKIIMKSYGNVSDLISFGRNEFILKPGETVSIDIFSYTNDFTVGSYSGEVDIIVKKPIYNFLCIS